MENNHADWSHFRQRARTQLIVIGGFIALIWLIEVVDWLIFNGTMDGLGIRPRTVDGLSGILFAPLLHGGFAHLAANTLPLALLGWLILSTRRLPNFAIISVIIVLIAGVGTWLIGRTGSVHLGASGLVFGYFGFLLAIAYFEKSFQALALAIVVIFLYGGMIWGILPQNNGISWQSHLFGFFGGGTAAYYLGKQPPRDIESEIYVNEELTD